MSAAGSRVRSATFLAASTNVALIGQPVKRRILCGVQRTHAGLQAVCAHGWQSGRPSGPGPRYQKIPPTVKERNEPGQESFREPMHYFHIGSRRTLHKILRLTGCPIISPSTGGSGNPECKTLS